MGRTPLNYGLIQFLDFIFTHCVLAGWVQTKTVFVQAD